MPNDLDSYDLNSSFALITYEQLETEPTEGYELLFCVLIIAVHFTNFYEETIAF